jgi:hypothetical protein
VSLLKSRGCRRCCGLKRVSIRARRGHAIGISGRRRQLYNQLSRTARCPPTARPARPAPPPLPRAPGSLYFPCLPMCFCCRSSQAIDLGIALPARADLQLRETRIVARKSISDKNNAYCAAGGFFDARGRCQLHQFIPCARCHLLTKPVADPFRLCPAVSPRSKRAPDLLAMKDH